MSDGKFTKSMLKVGTYHSPDGVVEVTPERLKHWASETKRLQSVGYAIPSHFDHSSDLELLEPITMDTLERKQNRSAEATVGRLADIQVAADGQSAEITLETLNPRATEAVASNSVYVSPVIFPEWTDGAGNTYNDVITSFDLVDHPVDHSQSSFQPALAMSVIRMGINTKPFRLGAMEDKKYPDDEMEATEDVEMEAEAPEPPDDMLDDDTNVEDDIESDSQALADVVSALAKMNIVLPPDTAPGNFLERLHTALLTSAAHQGLDDDMGEPGQQATPEAASPMIATMSVQAKAALRYAEQAYSQQVKSRLAKALREGRCKPSEADQQKRVLGAIKLSLGTDGKPHKCDVEKWLDSREAVPKGTFWSKEQKTNAVQKLSAVEPPSSWNTTQGISQREIDDGVAALTRGRFKTK